MPIPSHQAPHSSGGGAPTVPRDVEVSEEPPWGRGLLGGAAGTGPCSLGRGPSQRSGLPRRRAVFSYVTLSCSRHSGDIGELVANSLRMSALVCLPPLITGVSWPWPWRLRSMDRPGLGSP